jgi:catechol 2,3-dioxygenase-like lactoylglutathione lyase family enzyme
MARCSDTPPLAVYETVLYADDVAGTAAFYEDVLGLPAIDPPDRSSAAFRLGGGVLLLFDAARSSAPGRSVPSHGARGPGHVAFAVAPGGLAAFERRLERLGVEIERDVSWRPDARSLYFRDPDGNSVELVEGEIWAE